MNRLIKQMIVAVIGVIALFFLIGIAGKYEYAEQVVYNMPESAYEAVVSKLGKDASQVQIAREYQKNIAYYNKINTKP